jgi:hypothetical protein
MYSKSTNVCLWGSILPIHADSSSYCILCCCFHTVTSPVYVWLQTLCTLVSCHLPPTCDVTPPAASSLVAPRVNHAMFYAPRAAVAAPPWFVSTLKFSLRSAKFYSRIPKSFSWCLVCVSLHSNFCHSTFISTMLTDPACSPLKLLFINTTPLSLV